MPATSLTRSDLRAWPKADLHCHLDGSLRPETMVDLARRQGKINLLPADSAEGLREELRAVDRSANLAAYLAWFQFTVPLMQSKKALARTACELVEDAARENVRYLEVRYAPILHTDEGLTLEAVNDAVLEGLTAGQRSTGVRTALILCALRDQPASTSLRQAELAAAYRNRGVVAFDLAGQESGHPPKEHLSAFHHARNHLLSLTAHAGESHGPASIRQALFFCDAHRIGHGTTLHQSDELLKYFVDHQIPLEICPSSNVQTRVVGSLATHPLTQYVDAGAPITINTDNRLFSRTSVTRELWRVHRECKLDVDTLREITLNGFRHAFLPWQEKQDLLGRAQQEIDRLC